jgi:21S rRNA (GM2251-2'-O)-methyltransferase
MANTCQGIVLEASPLPISNLLSLTNPVTDSETGRTSFAVLQAGSRSTTLTPLQKQPLLLLVDDVLDGGNLGAVLRSAYFLGVDAVLLTAHVAPLNAVALKASAGAAEALPIFRVDDPGSVLRKSKANGWHVLAATTPGQQDGFGTKGRKGLSPDAAPVTIPERNIRYHMPPARSEADITTRLGSTPQVLVIGGEGRGLRSFITKEADAFLEVLSPRQKSIAEVGLDSLNVSVAAAVALQEVLGRMRAGEVMKKESKKDAEKDTREDAGVAEVGDVESGDRMFTLSSDIGERLNELQEDEAPVEEVRASSG